MDIVERLADEYGFRIHAVVDLSAAESRARYLEGTGSLVLDRTNRVAYAALSTRTHPEVLSRFARLLDYEVIDFLATDENGDAIYHTNVMMCIGTRLAIVCLESVADRAERARLEARLLESGHEIIDISRQQVTSFAGNMLELVGTDGNLLLAMSLQAQESLTTVQLAAIERHDAVLSAPVGSIEKLAGGSVRCMLAEIHLPSA